LSGSGRIESFTLSSFSLPNLNFLAKYETREIP